MEEEEVVSGATRAIQNALDSVPLEQGLEESPPLWVVNYHSSVALCNSCILVRFGHGSSRNERMSQLRGRANRAAIASGALRTIALRTTASGRFPLLFLERHNRRSISRNDGT